MTFFRDPTRSMWARALEMLEQSERLHRQFFQLRKSQRRGPTWEPPADVFESARALTILVALPGVNPDDVEIVVDGGTLYVVGERSMPAAPDAVIRRLEIPYGRFERRIDLPQGHFEIGERVLANGCLRLILRKLV
ncbi:MAG: Hsp20/alpha crystallin family protein [Burkholderiaceae bacterium]|nr:Hsp20/alpha crystallin family protein [Burkholderiaceae bacterium]